MKSQNERMTKMPWRRAPLSVPNLLAATCFLVWVAIPVSVQGSVETFGNFHTVGVVLDSPPHIQEESIARVELYELYGQRARRLQDPVKVVGQPFWAGSVFDLHPDKVYRFRADYIGHDGKGIHREQFTGRTRPEPGEPPRPLREIHVATTGRDENPGTRSLPLRTLAAALRVANQPGTHVVIHEGTYYEGGLPTPGNGTADAPIVIRGVDREKVILDGSAEELLTAEWKSLGGDLYSAPYEGQTWVVAVRDNRTGTVRRMYPVGSLENLKARQVGKHSFETYQIREAWFCTGQEIFVYCPDFNPEEMTSTWDTIHPLWFIQQTDM